MNALASSATIFILMLVGIWLGALLRRILPRHHLNEHAKDSVRLGVGLIAAIAALVLGLLISAAKSSFETQSGQVKQITANLLLLDSILAQYGPEGDPIRQHMREAVGPFADRLWHEKEVAVTGPYQRNSSEEEILSEIHRLPARDDVQRSLQIRAANILADLAQVRFMLFAEPETRIPEPFLAILAFWLVIVFASYSLFSPLNVSLFTCLSLFAFSAASAIFLILELGRPFTGLMMVSSVPLRNALGAI
ncbi:MAG: hypothetical protein ACJ8F3_15065 [Xanthobacteraceae bacterium]